MQIQSGKLYENRTWKYLYPCINLYGSELTNQLNSFFKLGVGIGDKNSLETRGQFLYILIDTNMAFKSEAERTAYKVNFGKFLNWLSYMAYYEKDYVFESINNANKHMIVLKMPVEYEDTILNFTKGLYSKLYSLQTIRKCFKFVNLTNKKLEAQINAKLKETRDILLQDPSYKQIFLDKVNADFKIDLKKFNVESAELDYPPVLQQEIFNYGTRSTIQYW